MADERRLSERPRSARRKGNSTGPVAIRDLLLPSLTRLGLRGRALEAQVMAAWPAAVGEMVARETHCASFARGRLTVESSSPALSHQLLLQKQTIVEQLNSAFAEPIVRDLRFRLLTAAPGEKAPVRPGQR